MSDKSINHYDYYNINQQPNQNVNPNKSGAIWNANDNDQLKCCIDNTTNENKWVRFNPDLPKFDDKITDIENKLEKPEFIPPINGYKSQVIARYLVIDGDDGNGSAISFGNRQIKICPHWYHKWSGGDEYGCVALMIRDIGYIGSIGRLVSTPCLNNMPKSITLSNGVTLGFQHTGTWEFIYKVTGGELPLWPKSNNFAIGKLKFYILDPNKDSRMKPYWRFSTQFSPYHDYRDLLESVPFPYDRYHLCKVREAGIPTTEVNGYKAVSKYEWDMCLDTRKKVDTGSNTYLIPIVSPNNKPYNARDEGISGLVFANNGLSVTFIDVFYDGEADSPIVVPITCDGYINNMCKYKDNPYNCDKYKTKPNYKKCPYYQYIIRCDKYNKKYCSYMSTESCGYYRYDINYKDCIYYR